VTPKRDGPSLARILVLVAAAAGFGQFGAVASLADVARHFGTASPSNSIVGAVGLSGTVLGSGLAILRLSSLLALPLASLADRVGRQRVLRRCLVVGLVATGVAALSPSYWFFVGCFALARPLLTASTTLVQVVSVEISSTERRVQHLVWIALGAGSGAGLSAVLHGIVRGPDSFRWLFATALLPAIAIRPLLSHIPETRLHSLAPQRLGVVARASHGRLAIMALLAFIIGVITGPANGFAFVYGEGILKISPHVVATVVTVSSLGGLAGLGASRWLSDRFGRRPTVVLGIVTCALTSSLAYSGGRPNFILGYLFGVCAAALLAPAASALTNESFPHVERATAAGWIVVAGVLGAMSGLIVFGAVGDSWRSVGSQHSLRLAAVVTFLPLLPLLALVVRLPETKGRDLH